MTTHAPSRRSPPRRRRGAASLVFVFVLVTVTVSHETLKLRLLVFDVQQGDILDRQGKNFQTKKQTWGKYGWA